MHTISATLNYKKIAEGIASEPVILVMKTQVAVIVTAILMTVIVMNTDIIKKLIL